MIRKSRFTVFRFIKIVVLICALLTNESVIAQATKLPQPVFLQFIDSIDRFEINHATQFKHIDLPKKYYNTFLSYVKDSVAVEQPGLETSVYYSLTLFNDKIINGDIYWNDAVSYIVFKVDEKKYVNYYTKEGVAQIKMLFKL